MILYLDFHCLLFLELNMHFNINFGFYHIVIADYIINYFFQLFDCYIDNLMYQLAEYTEHWNYQ